jgi:hypothetical protein
LQRGGDEAGVRIWSRVADHLTRISKGGRHQHPFFD